ncbi:MAG: TetR/AcrR family transcriptional regulator [Acidimicrobiia bacterium]|nr:TetR/AcrR family transcriptional regulator [Acidimicrobiia bacterium]
MTEPTPAAPASGWERRRYELLSKYEQIGLELFAEHGFRNVTFDAIADAAGVSARTLFRYFPTKEDFLLGYPRRTFAAAVEMIAELEPSEAPVETVWQLLRGFLSESPLDVGLLTLWRRAAADAPEVHDRVRGERTQALLDAVAGYCARSLGTDRSNDARADLLAGIVAGAELALITTYGRSESTLPEILDVADGLLHGLDGSVRELAGGPITRRVPRG